MAAKFADLTQGIKLSELIVLPHSAEAATAYESAFSDSSFANPGPPKEDPESSLGGGKFEFDVYPPLDGPDDTTPTATNFHHASYAMHPFFMCFLAKFDYLFHHVSPRVIDSLPDRWKRQLQEKPRDDITWTLETVKNMTESTEAPASSPPSSSAPSPLPPSTASTSTLSDLLPRGNRDLLTQISGVNTEKSANDFYAFSTSQIENGIAWLDPRFLDSPSARQFDDDESVPVKVMQALYLPFPELLENRAVHDFNALKRLPGALFINEFSEGMELPIFLSRPNTSSPDFDDEHILPAHERLHPDGILIIDNVKSYLEFSRCSLEHAKG
ncbi:unnamed protein product [Bathycoccus prasinos]